MPYSRFRSFLAQRGGAVPFSEFMEAALYDPANGYYTRRIKTVGRGGDFSTAATLSPLLGRAIVGWMREGEQFNHLIEVGPGNGALAAAVLKELGWWKRRGTTLWLVEKSPVLRAQQQAKLKQGRVRWVDSVTEALERAGGEAMIYSNELVDAFPVILAEWREGAWQEVWLELTAEGRLVETLRPLKEEISSVALREQWDRPEGQRVEIPWSFREWLAAWRPAAKNVRMLTIDYGGRFPELHARRPAGTLRAYLRHERKQGTAIYENMGSQDLTADVCFDDLIHWGGELGLETILHLTQGEFLQRYGKPNSASLNEEYVMREDGAGGAFRVLAQEICAKNHGKQG
jgi:SAM-dependent MidA family methyltransferase